MVFTILSAILHLTNIRFSHDDETDGVYIEDEYPLEVGRLICFARKYKFNYVLELRLLRL
jgi:hypothetical protein